MDLSMPTRASDVFEALLETRGVPRATRIVKGVARVGVDLLTQGDDPGFDVSARHFRVVVRDRSNRAVVHEQSWGGDEAGARRALAEIEADLARLDVAAFRAEYGN